MPIIKSAGLIKSPDQHFMFKRSPYGKLLMMDGEYKTSFMPDLEKVHALIKQHGISYIAAIDSAVSKFVNKTKIKKLIEDIGESAFKEADWKDISDEMSLYRQDVSQEIVKPQQVTDIQPPSDTEVLFEPDGKDLEEEPASVKPPAQDVQAPVPMRTQPVKIKIKPQTDKKDILDSNEVMQLTVRPISKNESVLISEKLKHLSEEDAKQILRYSQLDYEVGAHNTVVDVIKQIIELYKKIGSEELANEDIIKYNEDIQDLFNLLDEYHTKALEVKNSTFEEITTFDLDEDGDTLGRQDKEDGIRKVIPEITLSAEDALKNLQIDSGEYLSFENGVLTIKKQAIDIIYENIKSKIFNWSEKLISTKSNGVEFIPADSSKLNELNNIMYGAQIFDSNIYNSFLEIVSKIDNAISKEQDKENLKNLLNIKRTLNQQLHSDIKKSLISYRFFSDDAFAEKISLPLLYIGSLSAFENFQYADSISETSSYMNPRIRSKFSAVPDDIKQDQNASITFINELKNFSVKVAASKFRSFWDVSKGAIGSEPRNFCSFMQNLNAKLILKQAVYTASRTKYGLVSSKTIPCPTCNKSIEWSTGSSQNERYLSGYYVNIYSPIFKVSKDLITEDFMKYGGEDREIKYRFDRMDYMKSVRNDKNTAEIIKGIDSSEKTWTEINDLIKSPDFFKQAEGYMRRSYAFSSVGATKLKTINVNSIKFMCPISTSDSEQQCGISFNKPNGGRSYNMQPTWNNEFPDIKIMNGSAKKVYSNKKFLPDDWEDESAKKDAIAKTYGGYKFSKQFFGCPCHIDPKQKETFSVHSNIAIKISSGNYQPPTDKSGEDFNLDENTYSYLICGANTSLSMVDRDPLSDTYFLKKMKDYYQVNPTGFASFISFMIGEGFDELEMMQMLEDVTKEISEQSIKTSSYINKINDRALALERILNKNAMILGDNIKDFSDLISDLTLTCPFGHKFTIGKSLKFGASHTAIKLQNTSDISAFKDLAVLKGRQNTESLKRLLRPISSFSSLMNFVYYDEWINISKDLRRLSSYGQRVSQGDFVYLKINIDGQDYAFPDDISIYQDLIWSPNGSRDPVSVQSFFTKAVSGMSTSYVSTDEMVGEEGLKREYSTDQNFSYSAKSENISDWERKMSNIINVDLAEEDFISSKVIPGGVESFDGHDSLFRNMESLSRSIVAALTIVSTWTNNLVDNNFGRAMVQQALKEEDIQRAGERIFAKHIHKYILQNVQDQNIDNEDLADGKIESEIRRLFSQILIENSEISSLIRKGRMSLDSIITKIISETIIETSQKLQYLNVIEQLEEQGKSIDIDIPEDEISKICQEVLNDPEFIKPLPIKQQTLSKRYTSISDILTTFDMSNEFLSSKEHIVGKLTLIAYARFVAMTIFKMQQMFFTKTSSMYVGFNPLPRRFSNIEDVMTITKQEIDNINIYYALDDLLLSKDSIFETEDDINENGAKYVLLTNKAYEYLDLYISNARNLVVTPTSLAASKQFVIDRLGEQYIQKYLSENEGVKEEQITQRLGEFKSKLDSNFSVTSASYKQIITSNPETEQKYCPMNIVPAIYSSKNKPSFEHKFYDQVKVMIDEKSGKKFLTHDETGFDNSKIQVGFFSKPTVTQWPLPKYAYKSVEQDLQWSKSSKNHVGIPIPLYDKANYKSSLSMIQELPLISFKPIVKVPYLIDGEQIDLKLDISFLLERGFSREHVALANSLESELNDLKLTKKEELAKIENIESINQNKISALQDKIAILESNLKRAQKLNNKDLIQKYDEQKSILISKIEQFEDEIENKDKLIEKLNVWYIDNIQRIQSEFNELPYNINTSKGAVYLSNVHYSSLESGKSLGSQRKNIETKREFAEPVSTASVAHISLFDPIFAYKVIKNRELHGNPYVNIGNQQVPEEVIEDALITFIVKVYGLDEIAKIYVSSAKQGLTKIGINPDIFDGRELLEATISGKIEQIDSIKYNAENLMPGQWFDISEEDTSISLQVNKEPGGIFPHIKAIENLISSQSSGSRKKLGLTRPFAGKDDPREAVTVSRRAANQMKKYIDKVTRGEYLESSKKADDHIVTASGKYFDKKIERAKTLSRIMISRASELLSLDVLFPKK